MVEIITRQCGPRIFRKSILRRTRSVIPVAMALLPLLLTCSDPNSAGPNNHGCEEPGDVSCSGSGMYLARGIIYTLDHELVAVVKSTSASTVNDPFSMYFYWDGCDCNGNQVETGAYILVATMCVDGAKTTTSKIEYVDFATEPPATPRNLTVRAGDRSAYLAWDRTPDAIDYLIRVYDLTDDDTVPAYRESVYPADTIGYLFNDHTYVFSVAAGNSQGPSPFSEPETLYLPQATPVVPTEFHPVVYDRHVTIVCENVPGALFYTVYFDTDRSAVENGRADGSETITLSTRDAYSYSPGLFIDSVYNDSLYYYALVAGNDAGVSPLSAIDTFRTVYETPYIEGYLLGRETMTVVWRTVPRAVEFRLTVDTMGVFDTEWRAYFDTTSGDTAVTFGTAGERKYRISVDATDGVTWSDCKNPRIVEYIAPPSPLIATAADTSVVLTGFGSLYAKSAVVSEDSIFDSSDTWYEVGKSTGKLTVPGLVNGKTYCFSYRWKISDASFGKPVSALSDPVVCIPRPTGPSGLAWDKSDGTLLLSWSQVTGASGYYLYIEEGDSVSTGSTRRECPSTADTVTGLLNSHRYSVLVSAVVDSVESQVTRLAGIILRPATPENLEATVSGSTLTVQWEYPDSSYLFNVYYCDNLDYCSTNYNSTPGHYKIEGVTSPYTIEGVTVGNSYEIIVTAVSNQDTTQSSGITTKILVE
ncbi:MAG: fibronectin type III domain-containing protein [Chitinispirillaceae bacterium]|nr:fibronectin type III domain-containing protein [Chitinispirillaceae bacterium]